MSSFSHSYKFNKAVIQWYKYNNYINMKEAGLEKIIKEYRMKNSIDKIKEKRDLLGKQLIVFMGKNGFGNGDSIKLGNSGNEIQYKTSNTRTPITKKYLQKCFQQYFKGDKIGEELLNFIYENRDRREKIFLKLKHKSGNNSGKK